MFGIGWSDGQLVVLFFDQSVANDGRFDDRSNGQLVGSLVGLLHLEVTMETSCGHDFR